MKNYKLIILSALILLTASCRKEGDYFMNPNDLENAFGVLVDDRSTVGIFETIWSAINTGYAFWDITTEVDWDQRYKEFKPKFEEIDRNINNYTSFKEYLDDLQVLYDSLTSGLKDGHMAVLVGNSSENRTFSKPSEKRNSDRLHDDDDAEEFRTVFLANLARNERVSEFEIRHFTYNANGDYAGHAACVYTLSDGRKIPYLWNSSFVTANSLLTQVATLQDSVLMNYYIEWQTIYDRFVDNLINIPKSEIGGVILDLRANGGGELKSLPNYINVFAGEEHTYWETRYKEGMGRYDMSAWVPFQIGMPERHRDLAAENIPIVVLCDVNSVSCSEITTGSIKQMPTGHVIGERTWGGHGPLSYDNTTYNLIYGGVSGKRDMSLGYFVYTANYENRPVGGPVLEGIGITPDEEVLYKNVGYQGQFDAAIKYLESLK